MNEKYWDRALSWVDGCTPCSPGCERCWSAGMAHRFHRGTANIHSDGMVHFFTSDGGSLRKKGAFNGLVETRPERLSIPLKRRKPTVYAVWNDLFHEAIPFEFWVDAYKTMAFAMNHTFLVLTKRPQKMLEWYATCPCPLSNIYHGLTICNQQEADEKIPVFLQVPGKKFLSIEPCLGEIDISGCLWEFNENYQPPRFLDEGESYNVKPTVPSDKIDAVILGGETLGNRPGREIKIEWAESVADQCEAAGIPLFVKQLHIGGKVSKNITEWPEKLQRRELPWRTKP